LHHRPPSSKLGRLTADLHPECGHADWSCTSMTALCRRVPRYSSHGVMWGDRVGLHHLTAHSQCAASAASASTTFLVPKVGFEPTDSSV
jgi:hypothetical protein